MQIIPAIDLLEGKCVRLHQGNYQEVTEFNNDPVEQALYWEEIGATRLHLVDLDGAKSGQPVNDTTIRKIISSIKIPVQLGGGIRSLKRAEELLNSGIDRVILGTVAIEKPDLIEELIQKHPRRVIVGIDAKDGKVATRGWLNESNVSAKELANSFSNKGIAAIIFTDIKTDGTLKGPNLKAMREIAEVSHVPIIASGGIGCISDLLALMPLKQYGVTGVIVGRALYDGTVDLIEANKAIENFQLQDPPNNQIFYA